MTQEGKDREPENEKDVVRVRHEGGIREFTRETDGDNYVDLASKFAAEEPDRAII